MLVRFAAMKEFRAERAKNTMYKGLACGASQDGLASGERGRDAAVGQAVRDNARLCRVDGLGVAAIFLRCSRNACG